VASKGNSALSRLRLRCLASSFSRAVTAIRPASSAAIRVCSCDLEVVADAGTVNRVERARVPSFHYVHAFEGFLRIFVDHSPAVCMGQAADSAERNGGERYEAQSKVHSLARSNVPVNRRPACGTFGA